MHQVQTLDSIATIDAQSWDRLWPSGYPFVRHDFLLALEQTGCTTADTGWQPCHQVVQGQDGTLMAVMPCFLKTHSYGEYVFDWSWADAWRQCGLRYYPKLVNAIPFTPATGPRWAAADAATERVLLAQMTQPQSDFFSSGFHSLFPAIPTGDTSAKLPWLTRLGCQFHWFNQGYRDFDDFLERFNARKRKSVRRERRRVEEQGLRPRRVTGDALSAADWSDFYELYRSTYLKHSGHDGYLSEAFFQRLGACLGDAVMMVQTHDEAQRLVAAALYFYDADTLYGRYWGAIQDYDGLHFECCYYQGIEFALERGLRRFDPGAQGEHKIQRGFTPVLTRSLHWLAEPRLTQAVADFLRQEQQHIRHYCSEARSALPFRDGFEMVPADTLITPGQRF